MQQLDKKETDVHDVNLLIKTLAASTLVRWQHSRIAETGAGDRVSASSRTTERKIAGRPTADKAMAVGAVICEPVSVLFGQNRVIFGENRVLSRSDRE